MTVRAPIAAGARAALDAALADVGRDAARNAYVPFARMRRVHFARFVVLPDAPVDGRVVPASLVYASNVDGPGADHVADLAALGPGLDHVWAHCEGYPPPDARTPKSRAAFLERHRIRTHAFYVNTVGRTVEQARAESGLRAALEAYVDEAWRSGAARSWDAARCRDALRATCGSDETLRWALTPLDEVPVAARARERLRFFGMLAGLLVASPALLVVGPVWLLAIRRLEIRDASEPPLRLSAFRRGALAVPEDHATQNQFSAIGSVKSHWLRRVTLRVLLAAADFACRHHFTHGDLGTVPVFGLDGVDTIHFAQWIVLDGGRRVLFLSNYDGSLTSYMDDFVNKVAWGLNAVFSHGESYPRTRWLILDGARDEQGFKAFLQKHQISTQAWYTAYPDASAVNLTNNAAVRAGLCGAAPATDAWARAL